ncbi:MAG: hypothetical protein RIT45_2705 [Pseudomonadota bacterium]
MRPALQATSLLVATAPLATALLLGGCGKNADAAAPEKSTPAATSGEAGSATAANSIAVEVAAVRADTYIRTLTLPGRFAPAKTVRVGVEMPGRVVELGAEEGEDIEADRVLVRLDSTLVRASVAQASAQVSAADVGVKGARIQFERTEALAKSGVVDQARLDAARIGFEQAKASRGVAAAAERAAQAQLARHIVRAPMAGRVLVRRTERGEYVNPGAPLFEIVDLSKMKLVVDAPEAQIGSIREGAQVRVQVPSQQDRELVGKVTRIPAVADNASRTFAVEVEVDNADGALRGGMMARAVLEVERADAAILVPVEAIVDEAGPRGDSVISVAYVAENGRAVRRVVRTGEVVQDKVGQRIRVLDGIRTGDALVVVGQRRIVDGDVIHVVQPKLAPSADEKPAPATEPTAAEPAAKP